jgi:hypothetical protein
MKTFRILSLLLPLAASIVLSSCFINITGSGISGNGNVITQPRTVSGSFSQVTNTTSADVEIVCKQTPGVEITADENIIQYIRTEVIGSTLRIYTEPNTSFFNVRRLQVRVNAEMINRIENTGSGDISALNIETTRLSTLMTGSGDVRTDARTTTTEVNVSGSGDYRGTGTAQTVTLQTTGSGSIDTRSIAAQQATATTTGSGDIRVFASQRLDATVSGSGDIVYYGNPATINRNRSGSGSISPGN